MNDTCILLAQNAKETRLAGFSLASTLYALPITICLTGDLGAGKTTFLQGFAEAIGIRETLTSPTYALEQRYESPRGSFLHLDLYRLTPTQAEDLLRSSHDFSGIRCIEWSDRASHHLLKSAGHVITIDISEDEKNAERSLRCTFEDAPLPTADEIAAWRKDILLPPHIIAHCDAVASVADRLADAMIAEGRIVRSRALHCASAIHDLLRFLDFRPGGHPDNNHTDEQHALWTAWRARFPDMHHERACAEFLRQKGYSVVAAIVEPHGFSPSTGVRTTIEQKLLFYADKRVQLDRIVTLEDRFADFAQRYGNGRVTEENRRWHQELNELEKELFPNGAPL